MPEVLSQRGWQGPVGVEPSTANMTLLELAEQLQVPSCCAFIDLCIHTSGTLTSNIQPLTSNLQPLWNSFQK